MRYKVRKTLVMMVIFAVFSFTFVAFIKAEPVSARESTIMNERKFFESYVVERGDTLWGIAQEHMCEEYDSIQDYIEDIIEVNDLGADYIRDGQLIVLPYYADNPELCSN